MRMSEQKQSELYEAIHEPIMQLRLDLASKKQSVDPDYLDARLFKMNQLIWNEVKLALSIT